MYVLRHSTHIIYDEAAEDEAAFIKCTGSQVVNGMVCFSSSCILRAVLKEHNSSRKWPIWPTPIYIWPKTRILGQPGYLTQRSIPDIILKILYQCLRNYRWGTELLPFDLLQSKPIFCIQRVMNGGGILPFPCLRPTIAEYNPWSIMIWVHLKISAGHHDDRNESGALGDLSGMPSAADLRGIPSVA